MRRNPPRACRSGETVQIRSTDGRASSLGSKPIGGVQTLWRQRTEFSAGAAARLPFRSARRRLFAGLVGFPAAGAAMVCNAPGSAARRETPPGLEVDVAKANFALLLCLMALGASTLAQAECFRTISEVRDRNVKVRWQETSANDGKPLIISIANGADGLVYSAKKAGVLWLSGSVSVCRSRGATDILLKNTMATSDVPMLARLALPQTQSAHIVGNQIELAGGGWGGTFIGQ